MNSTPATNKMAAFLDAEHFRYRRFAQGRPRANETALDSSWRLCLDAPPTALTARMLKDFKRFGAACMALNLTQDPKKPGGSLVRWLLQGPHASVTAIPLFDRQDRRIETFVLDISATEIRIEARHERGLLHGTHYLERLMADRGAPWLPRGRIEKSPCFAPRISNGVFIKANQQIRDPGKFSDDYLGLMSHFGVNGIHLYLNLWEVCRNSSLPELNSANFAKNIAALNAFNLRTLRFGIDLYLHINTRLFTPNHRVFANHPKVRGARTEIFAAELENLAHYNLCSGNSRVLDCYAETLRNLFTSAPYVAGAVVIVGGECFFHCFTRPVLIPGRRTNCPHCRKKDPATEVAQLVNRLAAAVKSTGRHKALYAWPYSAFVWSGRDRAQLRWIDRLSNDVSVLANFDTGQADRVNGDGVVLFDYNIKCIGPSDAFAAQARRLRQKRRPIFCKTETNTTPTAFFLPYLPVHHRWHRRFTAMRKTPVAGFIGQWRFFGMNGSPPEELQYHATWTPEESVGARLTRIAQRDFEIPTPTARRVVAAWKKLSAAWDSLPYSALFGGERWAYMRGPFYLGPAHPLILDPQDHYHLSPKYRQLRGDLFEMGTPDQIEEMIRNAKPRYVSDLLLAVPFGVERCLELLRKCRTRWDQGVKELHRLLKTAPSSRARMELAVCETIAIHLTAAENVIRFYQARDQLWRQRVNRPRFNRLMRQLGVIVQAEIGNAERSLPILARDLRIGYGHCYGIVYNAELVRDKLRQCRYLLEKEIPRLSAMIRFHLWNDFP